MISGGIKINCILSVISLWLYACKAKPSQTPEEKITVQINEDSFKSSLEATLINTTLNLGYAGEMTIMDSLLIVVNKKGNKALSIIDLKHQKLAAELIERGDQKGNCIGISSLIPTSRPGLLWVYDGILSKMIVVDIKEALKSSQYTPEDEFIIKSDMVSIKSPIWLRDSLFAACTYSLNDCRFFTFDLKSRIIEKRGSLPSPLSDWPEDPQNSKFKMNAMAYQANIRKQPHGSRLVVAYTTTDRLEIYNNGQLEKILKGPDLFDPIYTFKDSGQDQNVPLINKKTNFSHMQIVATDKYIYSLFSGKDDHNTCGSKIFVFDWNATPIKSIDLKRHFCTIAVHESGKEVMVYTVDPRTGNLASFKI